MRGALLLALLPSIALGQAAPWRRPRCTEQLQLRPEVVDVPPTADSPVGGWFIQDQLVCDIDRDLRKKQVVIYRDRNVEVTRAAPVAIAALLGLIAGAAAVLALQAQHSPQR